MTMPPGGEITVWKRMLAVGAVALLTSVLPAHAMHGSAHLTKTTHLAQVRFIWNGLGVQPPRKKMGKGKVKQQLDNQYLLRTQKSQKASIRFRDGTVLHLNQKTDALLRSPHVTFIKKGEVDEILAPGTNHTVQTATAVAAAIGTNYDVRRKGNGTVITVVQGSVVVSNVKSTLGTVVVKTNQQTTVAPNQSPAPPVPVAAGSQVGWTNGMPNANLPENLALDVRGGHVVGKSSEYVVSTQPDVWRAKYLIDGRLDWGWSSAPPAAVGAPPTPQWVKIGFQNNQPHTISSVLIDPAATHGDPVTSDLKDFEIRVSTTGTADSDFTTVLTGTCQQVDKLQRFNLPTPALAKYVELYAVSNYGSPDWVSVAEMEVLVNPGK